MVLFLSISIFAQTHEIVKHNGQKMDVNFIKLENNLLYYSPNGSSEELKISKYAVAFLNTKATDKSELITPKITINSKNDISTIIFLSSEQLIGLEKQTSFIVNHSVNKGGTSFFENEIRNKKIKYKVAELGFPFVFVNKKNGKYEVEVYNY